MSRRATWWILAGVVGLAVVIGAGAMTVQRRNAQEEAQKKGPKPPLEFAQTDAQTEVTDLTNELQGIFQEKLNPIIEQVRIDKGLLMIFSVRDAGVVAVEPGLDLSAEVIKRFDAASKTATKK